MFKIKLRHNHPKDEYPFPKIGINGERLPGSIIIDKVNFTVFENLPKNFKNVERYFIVEDVKKEVEKITIEPVKAIEVVKAVQAKPKKTAKRKAKGKR